MQKAGLKVPCEHFRRIHVAVKVAIAVILSICLHLSWHDNVKDSAQDRDGEEKKDGDWQLRSEERLEDDS